MRQQITRIALLAVVLLATLASSAAVKIDGIYYSFNGKTATVSNSEDGFYGYTTNDYNGDVIIPKEVSYKGVTYTVTTIKGAFYGCSGLTGVSIPNSVISINRYAYEGCTALKKLVIEDGETSLKLEYSQFSDCPLENVHIGRNLSYSASISSDGPFYKKETITTATIGDKVTSLPDYIFYGCTSLTSVTLSNTVTYIGDGAFYGCTGLTSVTLSNSVTYIGDSAFYGCAGLTSVTIPNSVTSIGSGAFCGCTGLTGVIISNSITYIGGNVFSDCTGLTSVTIPNSVTYIGFSTFSGCTGLTSVTIPNSVTGVGDWCFSRCSGLESIVIPNSVTALDSYAFSGCTNLQEVVVGDGVETIGDYAFGKCTAMTSLTSHNPVPPTCGTQALDDINKWDCTLYVPKASIDTYKAAPQWKEFFFFGEAPLGIDDINGELPGGIEIETVGGNAVRIGGADGHCVEVYGVDGRCEWRTASYDGAAVEPGSGPPHCACRRQQCQGDAIISYKLSDRGRAMGCVPDFV